MFSNFIKNFLLSIGFFLIGSGIGLIAAKNFQIGETMYWFIAITSLVSGGFFTAFSILKKEKIQEPIEEEEDFVE